jgi:hypothetical protein
MMNEELNSYAKEVVEALKESKSVRMEIGEDEIVMYVHVIDESGVKVCGFLIDLFEQAMEVLVYMIHNGDNYNYRMEGKEKDLAEGKCVYVHITNVPH